MSFARPGIRIREVTVDPVAGSGYRSFMNTIPMSEILKMSVSERIQLVEDIWDSIAADPGSLPLTEEQRAELHERIDQAEANPGQGRVWSEVRERLLGSR
jgi:putative addiction module component (TIGR02574 family)